MPLWSRAFGVAQVRIASVRVVPGCITPVVVLCRPADSASITVVVGHIFAAIASGVPLLYVPAHRCFRSRNDSGASASFKRPASGLGHADDEDPFAFVRRTDIRSP